MFRKRQQSHLKKQQLPADCRLYTSITELPLNKFQDALIDGNLSALIISGFPTKEQLEETWAGIQAQCADIAGTLEHKLYISTFREIHLLSTELEQIEDTIGYLQAWAGSPIPEEMLIPHWNKLEKLMYETFRFTPSDKQAYLQQLKGVYNRSRSIKINVDLKNLQLKQLEEQFNAQGATGKKPTREYFRAVLISLSDSVAYLIPDTITVFDFYERIRRANEQSRQLSKQRKHG